ncbi:phosphoesterase PA-phosphatase related protein [Rhodobacter ferrooxidans]|uniref:Phosphoesterase PA-phosphatase related protein n=2 Tax=Rhodobacter ferrooxidans TaxID=371731 RepID=C8S3J7_9RHOB|nr:phosphoesterase PA-phosphatase related protein [Rhodobacter sp. SW2]
MRTLNVVVSGVLALFITVAATLQPALAQPQKNWDKLSTALVFGLAGGAELATLSNHDKPGQFELIKTMASTLVVVEGLKSVVHAPRPDGSGNDSFPSGHAALAFSAATYFDIRYGAENRVLVPVAYGAAALTAAARVRADKHRFGDVAAGALIGFGLAHVFTDPESPISAYPTGDGVGLNYARRF